ncbi:hypothetical protein [Zavarzinia sp. CC-PAN008]|uniref:hypothetical protein n=1 Tax=Zavarzinia sp. CC-PAN008 TaxID=3243332 RepID=UPI003F7499CB
MLLVLLGFCLIQAVAVATGISPVLKHRLVDGDGYMYLLRAEAMTEPGPAAGPARINLPEGGGLHWTRPVDLVLLTGALWLSPLMPLHEGLFVWGAALSPLLGGLTVLALFWATAPLLDRRGQALAGLLFIVQKASLDIFLAGRPDHHALVALLSVVVIGAAIRMALRPMALRPALLAGGATALAVWTSVEALLPLAGPTAALAFAWCARGEGRARAGTLWFAVAALGSLAAWGFEAAQRDPGTPLLDSLSPVHVGLLTGAAIAFAAMDLAGRYLARPAARLVVAALCAGLALAMIVILAPGFLAGPYAEIDLRLGPLWLDHVFENQPLWGSSGTNLSLPALHALLPLLAIGWGIARVLRRDAQAPGWGVLLAGALVTFVPMLFHLRLSGHVQVFAAPLAAGLALAASAALGARLRPPLRLVAMSLPLLGLVLGPAFLAAALHRPAARTAAAARLPCDMIRLGPLLDRQPPRQVASLLFAAPELLYSSNVAVLAGPYHRMAGAIVDTVALFQAADDATARAIMTRRGLDTIAFCRTDREFQRYARPGSFAEALAQGAVPSWLRVVPLPQGFEDYSVLERVP